MGDYESSKSIFFLGHQSTSFNGWIGNRREMSNTEMSDTDAK